MTTAHDLLPADVQAAADWRLGEAAWRRADLDRLAQAASEAAVACIGGQVQLRLPGEMYELYWTDYDPAPRREGEIWSVFATRSWREMLFLVADLPTDAELARGARERFEELAGHDVEGLRTALWCVVYLEMDPDGDAKRRGG